MNYDEEIQRWYPTRVNEKLSEIEGELRGIAKEQHEIIMEIVDDLKKLARGKPYFGWKGEEWDE